MTRAAYEKARCERIGSQRALVWLGKISSSGW